MKAVTNTSDTLFRDGDLVINPGETVNVQDDRAEVLVRDYAWQFEVKDEAKQAPSEDEVKATTHAYQQPDTEIVGTATKPTETDAASEASKSKK